MHGGGRKEDLLILFVVVLAFIAGAFLGAILWGALHGDVVMETALVVWPLGLGLVFLFFRGCKEH